MLCFLWSTSPAIVHHDCNRGGSCAVLFRGNVHFCMRYARNWSTGVGGNSASLRSHHGLSAVRENNQLTVNSPAFATIATVGAPEWTRMETFVTQAKLVRINSTNRSLSSHRFLLDCSAKSSARETVKYVRMYQFPVRTEYRAKSLITDNCKTLQSALYLALVYYSTNRYWFHTTICTQHSF